MAEDRIFGKLAAGLLKCIDVVNSLSNERPFPEEILIDIGDDARIRIHPRIASKQPREPRALRAG